MSSTAAVSDNQPVLAVRLATLPVRAFGFGVGLVLGKIVGMSMHPPDVNSSVQEGVKEGSQETVEEL